MQSRYALYFIPSSQTPLALLGSALLGRDSETGQSIPQGLLPGIPAQTLKVLTAEPRRYGLHATLKAPFFLKEGVCEEEVIGAVLQFAQMRAPIVVPSLTVETIHSFVALTPARETPSAVSALYALEQLAAATVVFFEPLRGQLSEQEIARRGQELTPRQKDLLGQWGYPFVFDCYRFHITLTGTIATPLERQRVQRAIERYFGPVLNQPTLIDGICLCRQDVVKGSQDKSLKTAPFTLVKKISFGEKKADKQFHGIADHEFMTV